MNHQTAKIIEDAKYEVNDEGVFSYDQITHLHNMIDKLAAAIEKEILCSGGSQGGGHGF